MNEQISPRKFQPIIIWDWTLLSSIGVIIGSAISFFIWNIFDNFFTKPNGIQGQVFIFSSTIRLISYLAFGIIFGLLQKPVIKRFYTRSNLWVWATGLGFSIGGIIMYLLDEVQPHSGFDSPILFLATPCLLASLIQWRVLAGSAASTKFWVWVVVNLAIFILAVLLRNLMELTVIFVLVSYICTGITLAWLTTQLG